VTTAQDYLDRIAAGITWSSSCPVGSSGWGAAPWGSSPWGGGAAGAAQLCLGLAIAVRENVVRLFFSEPVKYTRWCDHGDASRLGCYSVAVVGGTGIDGLASREVAPAAVELVDGAGGRQVDLTVDRVFSPYGVLYAATVTGILSASGLMLGIGANQVLFQGLQKGLPSALTEHAVATGDIANPQTLRALFDPLPEAGRRSDVLLGTYRADGTGDLANDGGLTSYKKRLFRRLTTKKGRFGHLPNYGVDLVGSVKMLARPGVRDALAADAEEQIRMEPETESATVRVEVTESGVAFFRIAATMKSGRTAGTAVPVAFSPTEVGSA
jgi:hypothetical protein